MRVSSLMAARSRGWICSASTPKGGALHLRNGDASTTHLDRAPVCRLHDHRRGVSVGRFRTFIAQHTSRWEHPLKIDPARTDTTSYNKKQLVMGHCRMMRSVAGINRPRKRTSHETHNSCTHSRRRDADLGGMRHVGRRGYRRWHRFHARTHRAGRRDRRWIGYAVRHLPLGKPSSRKQRRGLSAWVGPT